MTDLPPLQTRRLRLRPMTADDAGHIVRWRNAPHVAAMMSAARDAPLTAEEHLSWFERTRSHRIDYIIELRPTSRPIGTLSLDWRHCPPNQACAESGRMIGERWALGRSYAKEAAFAWMDFAFRRLGLDWVYARTQADNAANLAISKALGFQTQPWPDWLEHPQGEWVFSVLSRDTWQPQKVDVAL